MGIFGFKNNKSELNKDNKQSLQEKYGETTKLLFNEKTRELGYSVIGGIEAKGLAEAGVLLGQYYAAKGNIKLAIQHYKVAAEASIAEGYWGLSTFEKHTFQPDMTSNWVKYVVKAAHLGSADGMNEAGNIYNRINDYALSIYWYKLASLSGKEDAYLSIRGITQKWVDAGRPLDTNNDLRHQVGLATLRAYSRNSIDQEYVSELMGIDNSISQLIVGDCLESGNALEAAFNMYSWSASKNSIAMNRAANMLMSGNGVNIDTQRALEYYQQAANLENIPSMFVMGEYCRNQGNLNLALFWYSKSYSRGYEPAGTRMQQLIS